VSVYDYDPETGEARPNRAFRNPDHPGADDTDEQKQVARLYGEASYADTLRPRDLDSQPCVACGHRSRSHCFHAHRDGSSCCTECLPGRCPPPGQPSAGKEG
jgi:hypothetical protein